MKQMVAHVAEQWDNLTEYFLKFLSKHENQENCKLPEDSRNT